MQNEASDVLNRFGKAMLDCLRRRSFASISARSTAGFCASSRNPAAAEELTVESFWRIHRAHARFEPAQGFEGWARRIATRAALDWLRATARQRSELAAESLRRSCRTGCSRPGRDCGDSLEDRAGLCSGCRPSCESRPRWR